MTVEGHVGVARTLAYTREGAGVPLVFLHGLGAARGQAQAAIADVRGIERITIDAPAHGESAGSPVALNFRSFAYAVLQLLDALGIEQAILGGISMGSGIALRIAVEAPERVRSLVLSRPAWIDEPGRPHLDLVSDLGYWITAGGLKAARQRLVSDPRHQQIARVAPLAGASVVKTIDAVAATGRPDVLSAMVDSWPVDDLTELRSFIKPALVISTEHDPLHPKHIADRLASALPNASTLVAPPRYLEPDRHQAAVTTAIDSFVAQHHR